MIMKNPKKIFASMLALMCLSGCKSIPSYSSDYSSARNNITGMTLTETQALEIGTHFISTFNTLGTPEFINKASSLYAEHLFINDTLSQFSSRQNLLEHFKGMNKRVSNVKVKLLNTTHQQDSAYIHWYMAYEFKIFGVQRKMASYGISEIKVNKDNQIIFQQDFWDPANGLYRQLPYVGGAYSWLLAFKKSS